MELIMINTKRFTTLKDFEEQLLLVGDVLSMAIIWWKFSGKLSQAQGKNQQNIILLSAMFDGFLGRLWALYCDEDKRTLSFRNYLRLINDKKRFRIPATKIRMWRNNVMQHLNHDASIVMKDFPLTADEVDVAFEDLIDAYRDMCKRFKNVKAQSDFDDKLDFSTNCTPELNFSITHPRFKSL